MGDGVEIYFVNEDEELDIVSMIERGRVDTVSISMRE